MYLSFTGRFDVQSTAFTCSRCQCSVEATSEQYINSGWWPGTIKADRHLFDEEMLLFWYHLKHTTPGTSEQKFAEAIEALSIKEDKVNTERKK